MEIRNVLLATDFSASAKQAEAAAIEVARRFGSRLHLVHALELPLPIYEPYTLAAPDIFLSESKKSAQEKLTAIWDTLRAEGLEGTAELGEVPAPLAIVKRAEAVDADLVVVGTEGHTGIRHLLMGSVAEAVIKRAPCSVLTARNGDADLRGGTVIVGTDFSEHARLALEAACALSERLEADLHLVHAAVTSPPLVSPYEIAVPTAYRDAALRHARTQLDELAERCRTPRPVTTEISTDPPAVALPAIAEKLAARIIVLGSHGRTGVKHALLGSVAERTTRHAPCSVWTLRQAPKLLNRAT